MCLCSSVFINAKILSLCVLRPFPVDYRASIYALTACGCLFGNALAACRGRDLFIREAQKINVLNFNAHVDEDAGAHSTALNNTGSEEIYCVYKKIT